MITTSETAANSKVNKTPQRVLIVDDEQAVLFAYCKMMQREGIIVDECECLDQALHNIRTKPYIAVIADMRLAGTDNLDGLEIIRVAREIQPQTRLILATGYGNHESEKAAREMGVNHYFEKPVRPSDILAVLKDLLHSTGPDEFEDQH